MGGLLRYGIPDFKMEKHLVERRVQQMEAEGVNFHGGVNVGVDLDPLVLVEDCDAVVLAGGAEKPRDLPIPGSDLAGIHFAMDFLPQQNRRVSREPFQTNQPILAAGKRVIVIGGGDTGSDCIGTSIRQGAVSVTQLEIMPMPPEKENKLLTWPDWPLKLRTSSSHEEGAKRDFAVMTKEFRGENGAVKQLRLRPSRRQDEGDPRQHVHDRRRSRAAGDGLRPRRSTKACWKKLGVKLDGRGNVAANVQVYKSSLDKVFACGDMRRGQSLVVWAIREGRQAAQAVDEFPDGLERVAALRRVRLRLGSFSPWGEGVMRSMTDGGLANSNPSPGRHRRPPSPRKGRGFANACRFAIT